MTRILFATPLILPAPAIAHAGGTHVPTGWAALLAGAALLMAALIRGRRA
ncbi:hypothetical protein [Limimaricola cinnabarinus]|nr:hypothetical protein [Limimaricola cinnabarinus]